MINTSHAFHARSMYDTGGGYNLEGVNLPHHTLRPSQLAVLHFSPKGPAWSQVNQSIKFHLNQEVIKPKSRKWDPPLDFYHTLSSKYNIVNGKPPRDRINKDIHEGES
jgi:hypothetical protein